LQAAELQAKCDAQEVRLAELHGITQAVAEQVAARRRAEEQLRIMQDQTEKDMVDKDRRYGELFHVVCQVDREIAARKEAEMKCSIAENTAREAVRRSQEQMLEEKSKADAARQAAEVAARTIAVA